MKGNLFFILIVALILSVSCRNSSKNSSGFVFPDTDTIPLAEAEKLSAEAIADIANNIASPVEIANLLQVLSVPYSPDYLATSINANRQPTDFDKALALGILGADLGYLNMYEKTATAINILSDIKKLAEGLKVGQFFDFDAIRRLSLNRSNLDSLLFLSVDSYTRIDKYLRDNGRGHLSALMIIGVWIEGQHLATQVIREYPHPVLRDRIGEQKIILNDLIMLAAPYCGRDAEFRELCGYLQEIREKFRDIKISYTLGDPVSVEKDGGLVVEQTETSIVEMSDDQLAGLVEITGKIRNKLVINN